MMGGGDHPQLLRRTLLRKEVQTGRTQLGFGGEPDCTPLTDDARDVQGSAQGLHKARIAEMVAESDFKMIQGGDEELNLLHTLSSINRILKN